MDFRVIGLDPASFAHLYGLDEAALARHGAVRMHATRPHAMPGRVRLRDLAPGEAALLVNHVHQPADTPYRASHAIFVEEGAMAPRTVEDRLPAALARRLLSLRAFDSAHMMVEADVAEGAVSRDLVMRFLDDPRVAYLQAHFARRGCYAARIERV
ncbi:MAG TPA: DUF1203 domain-containing protein [Lysobacter sp.]